MPVEQINGAETPTYLHQDQQGSIRLLTGSAGTVTGKCTFDAYGNKVESTGDHSRSGTTAQYTSSDTGLIYLGHAFMIPPRRSSSPSIRS